MTLTFQGRVLWRRFAHGPWRQIRLFDEEAPVGTAAAALQD